MKIDVRQELQPTVVAPKEQPKSAEEQKLREQCQEFEAILLQKMVEAMQNETKLFGEGVQGDFFKGMFAEAIAKELAKDPGLGLAESMIRSMQKQED